MGRRGAHIPMPAFFVHLTTAPPLQTPKSRAIVGCFMVWVILPPATTVPVKGWGFFIEASFFTGGSPFLLGESMISMFRCHFEALKVWFLLSISKPDCYRIVGVVNDSLHPLRGVGCFHPWWGYLWWSNSNAKASMVGVLSRRTVCRIPKTFCDFGFCYPIGLPVFLGCATPWLSGLWSGVHV